MIQVPVERGHGFMHGYVQKKKENAMVLDADKILEP